MTLGRNLTINNVQMHCNRPARGGTLLTDAVGQSLVKVVDGPSRHFADGVLVEAIFEGFFKLELGIGNVFDFTVQAQ